jgi:hypothetical protein
VLLGEDFVDCIAEFNPLDMLTGLRSFEVTAKHKEFGVWNRQFAHVEANAELGSGDVAWSQLVEVAEELTETNTLLAGDSADTCEHVIKIVRFVVNNGVSGDAGSGLGEVVVTVVEITACTVKLVGTIDLLAEVDIVDLIDVTLVHVTAEKLLGHVLGAGEAESIEDTEELVLGNVAVPVDVKVLEDWLHVHALSLDSLTEVIEEVLDL